MSHFVPGFLRVGIALCGVVGIYSGIIVGAAPAAGQTPPLTAQQAAEKPITSPTYRIATDDTLDISIIGQNGAGVPGQSRTVTVLADGTADLPYIGEKKIAGLTLAELRKKLMPAVEKELVKPAISIAVRGRYVKSVNVFGVLPSKGKVALRDNWRIRDVIASAGGMPGDRYEFYRASFLRNRTGETTKLDLKKLLEDGDQSQNLLVEDNDLLIIQPLEEAETQIQVIGQVARPGPQILPRTASIVDVLQTAGGPLPRASLANVNIKRAGKTITLDLRDYQKNGFAPAEKLQVGDTLVVPENLKEYYLLGAIGRAGAIPYPENETVTVYKAIAEAGGQVNGPDMREVRLTRKNSDGTTTTKLIDVDKMIKTGNLKGDVAVEPGDSIYVPAYRKRSFTFSEALTAISAATGAIFLFDRLFKR